MNDLPVPSSLPSPHFPARRSRLTLLGLVPLALLLGCMDAGEPGIQAAETSAAPPPAPAIVAPPPAVVAPTPPADSRTSFNQANAKAGAADAAAAITHPGLQTLTDVLRLSFPREKSTPGVPITKAEALPQDLGTIFCPGGGTLRTEGTLANAPAWTAGDRISLRATNCQALRGDLTVNGLVTVLVQAFDQQRYELALVMDALDMTRTSSTAGLLYQTTLSGDVRMTITERPDAQQPTTVAATRLSVAYAVSTAAGLMRFGQVWEDVVASLQPPAAAPVLDPVAVEAEVIAYPITKAAIDEAMIKTWSIEFRARVDTLNGPLGDARTAYVLSTTTPVVAALDALLEGEYRLEGRSSSLQVSSTRSEPGFVMNLDRDGDGTFEWSTPLTLSDLFGREPRQTD